jgi:hypothetical protein
MPLGTPKPARYVGGYIPPEVVPTDIAQNHANVRLYVGLGGIILIANTPVSTETGKDISVGYAVIKVGKV